MKRKAVGLSKRQIALLKLMDEGSVFALPPSLWLMVTELTKCGFLTESNPTASSVGYALTPAGRLAISPESKS